MMRARMLFVIGLLMIGIAGCRSAPEKYEYLLYLPEGYAERQTLVQEATELMKIFGSILQKSK